jgi:inner membrane protein
VLAASFAQRRLLTAALVFVSFHTHLIGDLVGARGPDGEQWPIPYFAPFSQVWQWTWSGQWALNGWPNILITALFLGITLSLARTRGYSPLEMISSRANNAVVDALRKRFPLSQPTVTAN